MVKLFLGVALIAAVLASHAQTAPNPFSNAPASRPSAPAQPPTGGPPPVPQGPVGMPPSFGPPVGGAHPGMHPSLPPPPPSSIIDGAGAGRPPGLPVPRRVGPEEEEIQAVRIGTVNGKHIYRGESAYLFKSKRAHPVTRRVAPSTAAPQAEIPPEPPVTIGPRPDLPSAVGRPNPR